MKKQSVAITAKWVEQARQECGGENSGLLVSKTPVWLKLLLHCFPGLAKEVLFRTRTIDEKIDSLIKQESISQIIEFAAGYSQRGLKFTGKYPDLVYLESDLPEVINSKLKMIALKRDNHILKSFNLIDDDIFMFDEYICKQKTIMATEGLMFYLRKNEMLCFLEKIERFLRLQGGGYFIFDAMHWEDETLTIRSMRKILVPLLKLENAPWPNFQDYHDGRNTLETKGFQVVGFEKKGKINIYTIRLNRESSVISPSR